VHKKVGGDNAPAELEYTTINARSTREASMAIYRKCELCGPENEGCLMWPINNRRTDLDCSKRNCGLDGLHQCCLSSSV
jgi:hypothetical protein